MPAWYDIIGLDPAAKEDETGMWNTVDHISTLIQKEIDSGIPANRIVLGGFSQGAAMSLLHGLSTCTKLGGLAILSGYLPLLKKIQEVRKDVNLQTPILMCHGLEDEVVQYHWGKQSATKLKDLGHTVEFKQYSGMGHSAGQEEMEDLVTFLKRVLA